MLDLYSDQEEVNLANDDIFQMISDAVVVSTMANWSLGRDVL